MRTGGALVAVRFPTTSGFRPIVDTLRTGRGSNSDGLPPPKLAHGPDSHTRHPMPARASTLIAVSKPSTLSTRRRAHVTVDDGGQPSPRQAERVNVLESYPLHCVDGTVAIRSGSSALLRTHVRTASCRLCLPVCSTVLASWYNQDITCTYTCQHKFLWSIYHER